MTRLEEVALSTTGSTPPSNNTVAKYLDLSILLVILTFSLLNAPRVLIYLVNHRSDAFQGYFLRSSTQLRMNQIPLKTMLQLEERSEEPLESSLPTLKSTVMFKRWHLPMHLSLRHPVAGFMQYHVLWNYTIARILLMVGYTAAVFCAAFYESNPFVNSHRAGMIVASQIPFAYALAAKNNVIGLLVGIGYEKLNYLHRHVGRLMVIGANVHALGFIYKWSLNGVIPQKMAEPFVRCGLLALTCLDLLGFFSIHHVRKTSYNLFLLTHIIGLTVLLVAVCLHQTDCIPYAIAGSVVYGLDHVIRIVRTRFTTATLQAIPELELARIDIPSLSTGWRAGQHIRLRVLSTAMGLWGMTEVHPFTISSATNTEEGLVLMSKRTGNWTTNLYEIAQTTGSNEQGQGVQRMVKVTVEGPYGGIGDTTIPNYSGAMFVVGGSGVTFALSIVQDLVLAGDRNRTKVIEVVWTIKNPVVLDHFIPLFAVVVSQSSPVRVTIFYTRATTHSFDEHTLPRGITLTHGRPNMTKLLDGLVGTVIRHRGTHGAFIAVCGPPGFDKDMARAVRNCDIDSKKAIGGIQFHNEIFGL